MGLMTGELPPMSQEANSDNVLGEIILGREQVTKGPGTRGSLAWLRNKKRSDWDVLSKMESGVKRGHRGGRGRTQQTG